MRKKHYINLDILVQENGLLGEIISAKIAGFDVAKSEMPSQDVLPLIKAGADSFEDGDYRYSFYGKKIGRLGVGNRAFVQITYERIPFLQEGF